MPHTISSALPSRTSQARKSSREERTSLWDSVEELVKRVEEEEEKRRLNEEQEEKRRAAIRNAQRQVEERRMATRLALVKNAEARQALQRAIEEARYEGRLAGKTLARILAPTHVERLRAQAQEQTLERVGAQVRIERQKHRLRNWLAVATATLCIGSALAWGGYQQKSQGHQRDLGALQAAAQRLKEDAQLRLSALERELQERGEQSALEEGQLREALRQARLEVEAAHKQTLELTRKKVAPKKWASSSAPIANSSPAPKSPLPAKTATQSAPKNTMAFDFGMSQDDCHAHDPLCGNL